MTAGIRRLQIGDRTITDEADCFVIAEIGHNHQGSVAQCKEMITIAKTCGVDAVKLQKRDNRTLFTRAAYDAPYDHENSYGRTYGEHREALEFNKDQYLEVQKHAESLGLIFFSTAFDIPSADFLADINIPAYKIASGDVTNTPLLEHVARLQKPIILSTGGASLEQVERAHRTITAINPQLAILQCTSAYPADFGELNLRVIEDYRRRFPDCVVGLSSHDNGIAMALVGYTLGARIVEKHFTLNRAAKGTDHAFSLTPEGLRKLVRDLKRARLAMGDGIKRRYRSEDGPMRKMNKKLVAARDLPAGHVVKAEDVAVRCPGDGLPPYEMPNVVGRKIRQAMKADDGFAFDQLA